MQVREIQEFLFKHADEKYRQFQSKLIPTVEPETVIGVRTPILRAIAKQIVKDEMYGQFLESLPHDYFEENQLHAFILSEWKDFQKTIEGVCTFLPFVDNWATCDQMSPKIFARHKSELLSYIRQWIQSDHIYTVRFGIGKLMQLFLDDDYDIRYSDWVSRIRSEEYYINMMIAWYFATALAKQYDSVIHYLTERKLDEWTHHKSIQKAIESYRITDEQKAFLRTLR